MTSVPSQSAAVASESSLSAVSWHAILAGAVAATALSLVLLILGTGLGLASISPFTGKGAGAAAFGVSTIAWLTLTQLASSGLGGYLTGRLRVRWSSVHTDEVYFRDTAHGFLAWTVATLLAAGLLSTAINAIVDARSSATAGPLAVAAGNADMGDGSTTGGYFVDRLFRANPPPAAAPSGTDLIQIAPMEATRQNAEAARILGTAMIDRALAQDDAAYLNQLVAQRTGLESSKAAERVQEVITDMRARSDAIRKKSAYTALWLFVSLLIGALVASWTATLGGRQRDLI